MIFKIYLEKSDEGGYTVTVPSLPGCISEGDTKEEAIENIKEAIELYLESDVKISADNPKIKGVRFIYSLTPSCVYGQTAMVKHALPSF